MFKIRPGLRNKDFYEDSMTGLQGATLEYQVLNPHFLDDASAFNLHLRPKYKKMLSKFFHPPPIIKIYSEELIIF